MAGIVQFGTSRFLQAHVDLMLSEARAKGQAVPDVTVVETTGNPQSQARVAAFAKGEPCPVRVRGLMAGEIVDETRAVTVVADGLSARADHDRLVQAVLDADFIVSNTGDRGFERPATPGITEASWSSYPELLAGLLQARFAAGRPGLVILPCELIARNGDVLRETVVAVAREAGAAEAFVDWLETACVFANTLVDRIVSEPLDPLGAVAEPYALWAIERQQGMVLPCTHDQIVVTDALEPLATRKLYILNLAHTLLAQTWQEQSRARDETVREIMGDSKVRGWLEEIMVDEVVPGFGDDAEAARAYWEQCVERFCNPFLDHKIADIAANHTAKIERRAKGFCHWVRRKGTGKERFARLEAALGLDPLTQAG